MHGVATVQPRVFQEDSSQRQTLLSSEAAAFSAQDAKSVLSYSTGIKCKYQFCWDCLADYKAILAKDNSVHAATCKWHPDNLTSEIGVNSEDEDEAEGEGGGEDGSEDDGEDEDGGDGDDWEDVEEADVENGRGEVMTDAERPPTSNVPTAVTA